MLGKEERNQEKKEGSFKKNWRKKLEIAGRGEKRHTLSLCCLELWTLRDTIGFVVSIDMELLYTIRER